MVSLSGALMPGPLLIYVLAKTPSGGARTGLLASLGHFTVEIPLIILIVLGVHLVLLSPLISTSFGILGGILLTVFGLKVFQAHGGPEGNPAGIPHLSLHPLAGGILFSTILNPTVPLWWITLGFALLMDAYLTAAGLGIVLWSLGHFTADLTWYTLISYTAWSGRKVLLKYQVLLAKTCSLLLIGFGLYFLTKYGVSLLLQPS